MAGVTVSCVTSGRSPATGEVCRLSLRRFMGQHRHARGPASTNLACLRYERAGDSDTSRCAPTLILAPERDFWSRPEDRQALVEDLAHSPKARTVVIPSATHFVHLDRPERGRNALLKEIDAFLRVTKPGTPHDSNPRTCLSDTSLLHPAVARSRREW